VEYVIPDVEGIDILLTAQKRISRWRALRPQFARTQSI
jgi:hypothetical protein